MCRAVTCSKCNKPTWAGCGAHVEQVLGHVAKAARCSCREQAQAAKGNDGAAKPAGLGASLRRMFGGQ